MQATGRKEMKLTLKAEYDEDTFNVYEDVELSFTLSNDSTILDMFEKYKLFLHALTYNTDNIVVERILEQE